MVREHNAFAIGDLKSFSFEWLRQLFALPEPSLFHQHELALRGEASFQ